MSLPDTLRFILNHPLNAGSKAEALRRYVWWQIGSRLVPGPVIVEFVNGSKLVVTRGRHGVTGNLYTRLHEFAEMGFTLHALREGDLFVDIGANIGSYTVLAASVPGTRCIAFEPAPDTYKLLLENIRLNDFTSRVRAEQVAIGEIDGDVPITAGLDTVNHIVGPADAGAPEMRVAVRRLENVLTGERPALIKIDVEGYETRVIQGAERILRDETLFAVVMEMNGSGGRYGLDENRLDQVMLDAGFFAMSYDPIQRRLIPLPSANPSGNRLYIRDRDAVQRRLETAPPFIVAGGASI